MGAKALGTWRPFADHTASSGKIAPIVATRVSPASGTRYGMTKTVFVRGRRSPRACP